MLSSLRKIKIKIAKIKNIRLVFSYHPYQKNNQNKQKQPFIKKTTKNKTCSNSIMTLTVFTKTEMNNE